MSNRKREMLRANTYTTKQAMVDLRAQMLQRFSGSLATIGRADYPLEGYPVCSVVPFMLDDQFNPVIMIAEIAEHTQNALQNPKASIFIREQEGGAGDVQTQWRICLIGDLIELHGEEKAAVSEKYHSFFPHSRRYDDMHNFHFFRLEVKKYRIIMGFGDIRWIAGDAPYQACPFQEDRARMIAHMNDDHADAMRKYLRDRGITANDDDAVTMVDLHQYGFVLWHQERLHFFPFADDEQPADALAVRNLLVKMAKDAPAA